MWPQVTWVVLLALTPWAGAGEVLQPSLAQPAVAASFTATLGSTQQWEGGDTWYWCLQAPC